MIKGKQVPHFSLKPEPTTTLLFVLVLISGLLITLSLFWQEDGSGLYRQKGILCAIVTGVLSFTLFLGATARYWFTHLWKKNTSPNRHRKHSAFHSHTQDSFVHNKPEKQ